MTEPDGPYEPWATRRPPRPPLLLASLAVPIAVASFWWAFGLVVWGKDAWGKPGWLLVLAAASGLAATLTFALSRRRGQAVATSLLLGVLTIAMVILAVLLTMPVACPHVGCGD